jgi:hypothetical protein
LHIETNEYSISKGLAAGCAERGGDVEEAGINIVPEWPVIRKADSTNVGMYEKLPVAEEFLFAPGNCRHVI